jgi:hypothetical protein
MLCGKNLTQWPWPLTLKINRFQILLRTKYVPSLVKIHWRMLILECSQGCYGRTDGWTEGRTEGRTEGWKDGRTDGSATISLRNFVGEGIIKQQWTIEEISIFSNSSHLEWRAELSDTILKWDYRRTIPAKFGLIWFSGFREEDLNMICYRNMPNLHNLYKSAERKNPQ